VTGLRSEKLVVASHTISSCWRFTKVFEMTAWSSLTVLKLKEELAARSITFPSKAKKADLVALLEEFELAATKVKALFSKL
jgi:uncharacterized membrane protein